MANKLGADSICAIIKACGESRVAILQFGDLQIWMDGPIAREVLAPAPRHVDTTIPEAAISEIQKQQEANALVQAELALKADQLSELMLTDPAEYEKLILQGDLEEDGQSETDAEA